MRKNILIISTSPRKGGNSDILADEFLRGAQDAGHSVEKVNLYDKEISFCKGCLACQRTQTCVIQDDVNPIVEKMLCADALVFATPVYYYGMSGQMKTMLDRSNPLYTTDYAFRNIYLLAAAAEDEQAALQTGKPHQLNIFQYLVVLWPILSGYFVNKLLIIQKRRYEHHKY